jgi:hypothetical protein
LRRRAASSSGATCESTSTASPGWAIFVELEAVSDAPGGLVAEEAKIAELRAALAITDDLLVARGYADLLERAGGGGLRSAG